MRNLERRKRNLVRMLENIYASNNEDMYINISDLPKQGTFGEFTIDKQTIAAFIQDRIIEVDLKLRAIK